ncbi:DUF1549 and DUF1553 domain-containing protein [Stieleria sp. TO1_6]|uniref:DUF1549 and DUF1553 domain-containing protein n=1 Tax=Stieleria tagensis TaxID=2956795 RepID=UPI00209B44D4|nr:DUF1549 and DUF1553 domain-containing protein [Stieleria tagensis]MCO8122222.1 DUF1549 and DUF1553 domain-containing protein [Stieleria tagensis]
MASTSSLAVVTLVIALQIAGAAPSQGETPADSAPDARAATENVDRLIQQGWADEAIQPTPQSGDAEFCRRVWLDFAGVAPPVWQLRTFLQDTSPDKRWRLIDQLLASPRFATHMANRWNQTLLPEDALVGGQDNAAALHRWLRKQFQSNTPYDHIIGGFLTAGGKSDRGPAIFYTSRNLDPVKLAASTSQLFMGIQLQCAQCHDHPYARWTQDDFWSFAAFFAQLELDQSNLSGGQSIEDRSGREVTFPETERVMSPRYPGVAAAPEPDPTDFRRRQLTIWLASRNNPYFARAAANRVWSHLFGRGLVEPVDAMDNDNPPSHPQLLDFLADYLIEQRFDLRSLYQMLSRTQAYGRSSAVGDRPRPPADRFAAMNVKTLSAEQYFDSLRQNVLLGGLPRDSATSTVPGRPLPDEMIRQQFLARMQAPDAVPTEYPHGVVQVLGMMNGPEMLAATAEQRSGLIGSLQAPFLTDHQRVETLFLACLSRAPTEQESQQFLDYLAAPNGDRSAASKQSDLAWVLLNTAECFVCP